MREFWVNVYPGIPNPGGAACFLGKPCGSQMSADTAAIGWPDASADLREVGRAVRAAGVGYRLHVRLKPEPYRRITAAETIEQLKGPAHWRDFPW